MIVIEPAFWIPPPKPPKLPDTVLFVIETSPFTFMMPPPFPAKFVETVLPMMVSTPSSLWIPPPSPEVLLPDTTVFVSVNVPKLRIPAPKGAVGSGTRPFSIVRPERLTFAPAAISNSRELAAPFTRSWGAPAPSIVRSLSIRSSP